MIASLKVVAYSFTPFWVAGIFLIFPIIGILTFIGGLYSLFLMYLGLQKVKDTTQDKLVGYFVVVIIVSIVVIAIIQWIVNLIALGGIMMEGFKSSY